MDSDQIVQKSVWILIKLSKENMSGFFKKNRECFNIMSVNTESWQVKG